MAEGVVALIGLRGSGKTTLGRGLAGRLGVPFVDLDERLARGHDRREPPRPAGEVLVEVGERRFRELETEALREVLAEPAPFVLATGGGVVETAECRELLAAHCRCVWLDADPDVLLERTASDPTPRPPLTALGPEDELASLAERRSSLYAEIADLKLDTGRFGRISSIDVIFSWLRS